jgi:hypothetical protein
MDMLNQLKRWIRTWRLDVSYPPPPAFDPNAVVYERRADAEGYLESDAVFAARIKADLRMQQAPPPPEMYDDAMANGTWPVCITREQAAEWWARERAARER